MAIVPVALCMCMDIEPIDIDPISIFARLFQVSKESQCTWARALFYILLQPGTEHIY